MYCFCQIICSEIYKTILITYKLVEFNISLRSVVPYLKYETRNTLTLRVVRIIGLDTCLTFPSHYLK